MFILDSSCISAQQTYDGAFLDGEVLNCKGKRFTAQEPGYGNLIPAGLLRRMGKAVRMGVGAGLPLIIKNEGVDGIILGTANGGLEDCLKFLNQIVDYNEGTLTPTNFVQSTPNAVAGNLALLSKTTGYNTTHVHRGLAFECALLDAILLLKEGGSKCVLLGAVEEISEYNYNIDFLNGYFKNHDITSDTVLTSDSPGSVCGEGAAMFIVGAQKTEHTLAEFVDVDQISSPGPQDIAEKLTFFLQRNGVQNQDIDVFIAGNSGDNRTDFMYTAIRESFFAHCDVYCYKHLVGDYPTASAFATWVGAQILSGKEVPHQMKQFESGKKKSPRYVLIYNHYQGKQHGFILLRAV